MKRITEGKKRSVGKDSERDEGSEGQRVRAFSFKAAKYVNQSSVCRNNGFKGHTLHNVAFNKMHRLWKTYIPRK